MLRKSSESETRRVLQSNPAKNKVTFKRNLTLINGCTLTIGTIIGSGIFVSPKGVLLGAGSVGMSLMIWSVAGLFAMLGALCYIELGTTFPMSGSDYTYLQLCLGDIPSFLYMWVHLAISAPAFCVINSLIFSNYVLKPFFPDCPVPEDGIRLVAACVICFITYLNCRNVQWVARTQDIFTSAKIIALLIIIIAGVTHMFTDWSPNFENAFQGTSTNPGSIALSFYSGMYAYFGWYVLNSVTEEIKDPMRNLPRAIYISVPFVIVIYLLTNFAYFAVLSTDEILSSNAVAVTFGERKLGILSWIMSLSVAISTFGSLNAGMYSSSRLLFVGSRQGHLPAVLSMININYFTPVPSLVFQCILSLLYLTTVDVYGLISYVTFVMTMFVALSVSGMLWMRYKKPDLERPIKMNVFFPVTFLLVCIALMIFPIYTSPVEAGCGIGVTLLGIPIYCVAIFWENKPKIFSKAMYEITILVQKLLLCVPEELMVENKKSKTEKISPVIESLKAVTEDLKQMQKKNIIFTTRL